MANQVKRKHNLPSDAAKHARALNPSGISDLGHEILPQRLTLVWVNVVEQVAADERLALLLEVRVKNRVDKDEVEGRREDAPVAAGSTEGDGRHFGVLLLLLLVVLEVHLVMCSSVICTRAVKQRMEIGTIRRRRAAVVGGMLLVGESAVLLS